MSIVSPRSGAPLGSGWLPNCPTLATVARHLTSSSADAGSWIEKCGLSNTQKMRLRTLAFGENVLLSSTQALRVVKRVSGRERDYVESQW